MGVSNNARFNRKDVLERRFRSIHPKPILSLDGAVPGAQILEQHRRGSARVQSRAGASGSAPAATALTGEAFPGLALRPLLPAGAAPTVVAAGDFNRDGHSDFVIANGLTNDLWIYLGKGDGTFQLPRIIPLSRGLSPIYIAAADLRHSGKLDLVVAEFDTSTIGVLLGNGDGTFADEQTYALPQPPGAIVVDDFDHDGKPDIAAVMDTVDDLGTGIPYIALLKGDGLGGFGEPSITQNYGFYSSAMSIVSGDVNGDGLPDLLITGPGIENSQVFLNNGDGTFSAGATVQENQPLILLDGQLADVNGDGCKDAIVADAIGVVWVAAGDCSGNFAQPVGIPAGNSVAAVRVVDVNGDGRPDIVTTSTPVIGSFNFTTTGNSLNVLVNDGKGNFSIARTFKGPGESLSFAAADFNEDGKPDFVTVNNDTDTASVFMNDGGGGFGFPQGLVAGISDKGELVGPYVGPTFADLNGDGKPDVFMFGSGPDHDFYTMTYPNDGTGRLMPAITSDSGIAFQDPGDYRLADFRHTGRLDLVAVGSDAGFVLFLPANADGTFGKGSLVSMNGADGEMAVGDFNGDGKLDFVTVNGYTVHTLTAYLGNGDGTFRAGAPVTIHDGSMVASRVYTGDFNHDGKLDVLVYITSNVSPTPTPSVWEFDGNGDGTFQPGKELFSGYESIFVADLNGDGCPDIARDALIYGYSAGETPIVHFTNYLCGNDGSFKPVSSYAPAYVGLPEDTGTYQFGGATDSFVLGDYNGDGLIDELAFQQQYEAPFTRYVQILAGKGAGFFTPTYDVFPLYLFHEPIFSHDLDGDGYTDMLELDILSDEMTVIKGARAPALQIALEQPIVSGNQGCGWVFPNVTTGSDRSATLWSSVGGVTLPASVAIPGNATSAKFCFTLASNYDWRQVFDVNAELGGDTATDYGSENYIYSFDESLSPSKLPPVYEGQTTAPVEVSITAAQGYNGTVNLSCIGLSAGDVCNFGAKSLDLVSNETKSTSVTLTTATDRSNHPFTIAADDGTVIRRQSASFSVATLSMADLTPESMQLVPPSSTEDDLEVFGIPPFTLTCTGLPAGATCNASLTDGQPYPNASYYTVTVGTSSDLAAGDYPFQIGATSEGYAASLGKTLHVLSFAVTGPSASQDSALVGVNAQIPITLQMSSNAAGLSVKIDCSFDVPGTCAEEYVDASPGAQSVNLIVQFPAGTPVGKHQITVTATCLGVVKTYTFPLYASDYSGTLSTTSLTMSRGSAATVTASLTGTGGFAGNVSLACSASAVLCAFNPASVAISGSAAQSVAITLTAGSFAGAPQADRLSNRFVPALAIALPLGLLAGLRRRRWSSLFIALLTAAAFCFATSCGGGGSQSGGGGGGSNNYSISVTASAQGTQTTRNVGTLEITVTH